ncbi:MAG: SDR family oxidoreductase [Actinomycetaceae bacterium]|nr:SDR family oxidoreductase [Actinomycetaceae bacterium]
MDLNLAEKVVLITGATGGIGKAIARAFLNEGSKLALTDISQEALDAFVEELGNPGSETVRTYVTNLTDSEEVAALADAVVSDFGGIYSVIACAGYNGKNVHVVDADMDYYKTVYDINVFGTIWTLKYTLPYMIEAGKGSVVVIGSSGSYVGSPGLSAYTSSKHAVAGLVKSVAKEVGPHGIHVNFIAPAAVDTDMMRRIERDMFGDTKTTEEAMAIIAGGSIDKRYTKPEEVADACLFLASEKSAHTMGHGLRIDGGKYI